MIDTVSLGQKLMEFAQTPLLAVEANHHPAKYIEWTGQNWSIAFGLVFGYLSFLVIGSKVMSKFSAFELKYPLALWNAFLCVFSFIGMCRTVPYLVGYILSRKYKDTVCESAIDTWGAGPVGFWVFLFIFSKIPELIDTVFIVLRKKPLIFLHWYHHVTVLLFCWSSFATLAASGLYFVAMNYTVHALMYGYYCLQALRVVPRSFPAYLITIMQIAQMFVGTGVCVSCWYYKLTNQECTNDVNNLIAGAAMYGSYLYLFCEFAVKKYIFGGSKKEKKEKKL